MEKYFAIRHIKNQGPYYSILEVTNNSVKDFCGFIKLEEMFKDGRKGFSAEMNVDVFGNPILGENQSQILRFHFNKSKTKIHQCSLQNEYCIKEITPKKAERVLSRVEDLKGTFLLASSIAESVKPYRVVTDPKEAMEYV